MPEVLPLSSIVEPELPSSAEAMARLTGGTEYVKLETLQAKGKRIALNARHHNLTAPFCRCQRN